MVAVGRRNWSLRSEYNRPQTFLVRVSDSGPTFVVSLVGVTFCARFCPSAARCDVEDLFSVILVPAKARLQCFSGSHLRPRVCWASSFCLDHVNCFLRSREPTLYLADTKHFVFTMADLFATNGTDTYNRCVAAYIFFISRPVTCTTAASYRFSPARRPPGLVAAGRCRRP